jgi:hypothetical protein
LKQALNARASVEIEKALARIACTASSCSRANPITVVAEQLGAQEARLPQLETSVASGHECLLQASRVVSVICADFKHLQSLLSQMVKVVAEMAALRAQLRQAEQQIVLHTAASALDVSKESLRLEKQAHSTTQQKLADASARIQRLQHTVDAFDNTDQELAVFVGKGPEFYVHKALNDGGEVAAAFTLHLPVEVDGSAVMRSFTGVLGNGADERGLSVLESIMRVLHMHIAQPAMHDVQPACRTDLELAAAARADSDKPLHRLVRALTCYADVPSKGDEKHAAAVHCLMVPYMITEVVRKFLNHNKLDGLQERVTRAQADGNRGALEQLLRFVGVSGSTVALKSMTLAAMTAELLSGDRLQFRGDSLYFYTFDNLGYRRQGGFKKGGFYQTVAMSWQEVTWEEIASILGSENADDLRSW